MNKYNEEIRKYEREAEDRYDDYDDDNYDDDNFDTGLEGQDSYDEDSYEEVEYIGEEDSYDDDSYDNYAANSIGKINPNDRTLTITITNTSGADAEAIIFGGNENAAQPAGVLVVVQESSHSEVREESKANPFKIQGMKMSVSDPLQFDNVWKILRKSAAGSFNSHPYQPRNATSPQNTNPNLIDDSAFEMDVTGQDSIRFFQKAGVKTTLTFTIKARVDMGNVLAGQNVAEISTAPRPTGLPQIDLAKQTPKPVFGVKPKMKKMVRKVVRRPIGGGRSRPGGPKRLLRKRR
jgi:predicted secreted protein